MTTQAGQGGGRCLSEGEPVTVQYQLTGAEDDAGITARLAKKLLEWPAADGGKIEVIRPGTLNAQYMRASGLKLPVLIKGDRFNENAQLGLQWADVHSISVDILADYIGGSRLLDTWDVLKQCPGPAWTLSQWCTYWHARQEAATRQAQPQTAFGAGAGNRSDDDDEDGEVVDSGLVLVLQTTGANHSKYNPAPGGVGIAPEQAQRLLDCEFLPLYGSQLMDHIIPPPALQFVDLVSLVTRDWKAREAEQYRAREVSSNSSKMRLSKDDQEWDKARKEEPLLHISPAETLHLQMTPKDCFSDFRLAPGGAATWLYVLHGVKVLLLLPPTLHNRRLFLTWSTVTRAGQARGNVVVEAFLANYGEHAVKVEARAREALIIPAGWFYATVTPMDSLAIGCYFWHPYALGDIARAQQAELQLKLKPRFSIPARALLWYAGVMYARQLRDKLGLAPYKDQRTLNMHGQGSGARGHSNTSGASLNQQRRSPYRHGMLEPGKQGGAAAAARGASRGQQQQGLPPLLGHGQQRQQQQASSGTMPPSPLSAVRMKRGRQEIEQLQLGEAAVPLESPASAAAGGGCGNAAAAITATTGNGSKKLRLATKRAVTPAGAGMTGSVVSTPRSAIPSSSNYSGQMQQPPQQRRRYVVDDDDEGECHTSPVRRPEPGPADDTAIPDYYIDWGAAAAASKLQQQQQMRPDAAKCITALKIKVPGRQQPLYSPVLQGIKGDLDSIPLLPGVTPPAAAAQAAAAKQQFGGAGLPPSGAIGVAAATPGSTNRKRILLKGQHTPTAAAVAQATAADGFAAADAGIDQRQPSPDNSSAGSHAVSAHPGSAPTQQGQQPVASQSAAPQAATAAVGQLQQHAATPLPHVQRRTSDGAGVAVQHWMSDGAGAAAAGAPASAAKAPLKLKFKLASPSPKLTSLPAPQAVGSVPPVLSLGQPAIRVEQQQIGLQQPQQGGAVQQQQQEGATGSQGAVTILQVDGANDGISLQQVQSLVQAGRHAMQQLLQRQHTSVIWAKWQQFQAEPQHHHHQQQQHCHCDCQPGSENVADANGFVIPQADGAGDQGGSSTSGPTLLLPPIVPASAAVVKANLGLHGGAEQQQQLGISQNAVSVQRNVVTIAKTPAVEQQKLKLTSLDSNPSSSIPAAQHDPPAVHQGAQQQQQQQHGAVPTPLLAVLSADAGAAKAAEDSGGLLAQPSLSGGGALPNAPSFTCWAGQQAPQQQQQQDPNTAAGPQPMAVDSATSAIVAAGAALPPTAASGAQAMGVTARIDTERKLCFSKAGSSCLPAAAPEGWLATQRALGMGDSMLGDRCKSLGQAATAAAPATAMAHEPQLHGVAQGAAAPAVPPQQQQSLNQAVMLPPPPTRLSCWEVEELPLLLQLLQEQAAEKTADIPPRIPDPDWLLQQLQGTIGDARHKDQEDRAARQQSRFAAPAPLAAAVGAAAVAEGRIMDSSRDQRHTKPPQQQQGREAADAAAAYAASLNAVRGPLVVSALAPDEMPPGFLEHWRACQAMLQGVMSTQHEATTEVVGETDPFWQGGSYGGGTGASWDNRSAGSIGVTGGSRGTAAAAAAIGRAAAGTAAGVGARSGVKRPAPGQLPVGVQQAKDQKKKQVLKGLGIRR